MKADVLHMLHLLKGLGVERAYVHHRDYGHRRHVGDDLVQAPATIAQIVASAEAIASEIGDRSVPAEVYVYFSTHGEAYSDYRGWRRARLHLQPDPDNTSAGTALEPDILHASVLDPLERVATVHVIVDACQSMNIVQPKGKVRRWTRTIKHAFEQTELRRNFLERRARTGVLTASDDENMVAEGRERGGVFSFALRSGVIAQADRNHDHRVTYAEIAYVLARAVHHQWADRLGADAESGHHSVIPGVFGIGGDDDAVLFDLDRADALARWRVPEGLVGRHVLYRWSPVNGGVVDPRTMFAAFDGALADREVVLPVGRYCLVNPLDPRRTGQVLEVATTTGPELTETECDPPFDRGDAATAHDGVAVDLGIETTTPFAQTLDGWSPGSYLGAGGGVLLAARPGSPAGQAHLGAFIGGRWGRGLNQLGFGLEGTWAEVERSPLEFDVYTTTVTVGYRRLLVSFLRHVELGLGADLGGGLTVQVITTDGNDGRWQPHGNAWLTADLLVPYDHLSLRISARAGAGCLARGGGDFACSGAVDGLVGVEYEWSLESQ